MSRKIELKLAVWRYQDLEGYNQDIYYDCDEEDTSNSDRVLSDSVEKHTIIYLVCSEQDNQEYCQVLLDMLIEEIDSDYYVSVMEISDDEIDWPKDVKTCAAVKIFFDDIKDLNEFVG